MRFSTNTISKLEAVIGITFIFQTVVPSVNRSTRLAFVSKFYTAIRADDPANGRITNRLSA
jgi:hypothetical protein